METRLFEAFSQWNPARINQKVIDKHPIIRYYDN